MPQPHQFGRLYAPDARDKAFPMRLLLDPLRDQYFPHGLPEGQHHYQPGKVMDQGQTGTCFPPGTLVRMASGENRPIEDIRLFDDVVTAEGRTGAVLQLMARRVTSGLVKLKLFGHGHLRMTEDHPVLTTLGYVAAKDLRPRQWVALPRFCPEAQTSFETAPILADTRMSRGRKNGRIAHYGPGGVAVLTDVAVVPDVIELTPRFGRLMGLFLAEGSTWPGKTIWTFGATERVTLVDETINLLTDLGITARIQIRPNNSINVVVGGVYWSHLFTKLCGTGAGEKGLSPLLASSSVECRRAILQGWLDGDGWNGRRRQMGISVSHRLTMDMFTIANDLGMMPAMWTSQAKPSGIVKSRRLRWELQLTDIPTDSYRAELQESATFRRVKGIEFEEYEGPVFNIHVEGDESYVAEGIGVHNCTAHGVTLRVTSAPIMQPLPSHLTPYMLYRKIVLLDEFPENDSEATAPDSDLQSGSSVRAALKAVQQLGCFPNYLWAESTEDVRAWHLAGFGGVVMGVNWKSNMMATDSDGFINYTGVIEGGHCIASIGWSDHKPHKGKITPAIRIQNSWGTGWGDGGSGRAWISVADLAKALSDDGEAGAPTEVRVK